MTGKYTTGVVTIQELQKLVEDIRIEAEALTTAAGYLEQINGHPYGDSHDMRMHAKALRHAMDRVAELYEIPF
jgi:hypothetical protein